MPVIHPIGWGGKERTKLKKKAKPSAVHALVSTTLAQSCWRDGKARHVVQASIIKKCTA